MRGHCAIGRERIDFCGFFGLRHCGGDFFCGGGGVCDSGRKERGKRRLDGGNGEVGGDVHK